MILFPLADVIVLKCSFSICSGALRYCHLESEVEAKHRSQFLTRSIGVWTLIIYGASLLLECDYCTIQTTFSEMLNVCVNIC